ncbi:hypothetical protein, partial [Enterococcus faecalis]|uniref:hypothetical protein n=1 Tax=Enterococcus faecalis TaxID=1351 RepID=UPI003F49ACF9
MIFNHKIHNKKIFDLIIEYLFIVYKYIFNIPIGSVAKFKIKIIFPNNSIIYAGIPKSTLISMQTEKPKRVPSFR